MCTNLYYKYEKDYLNKVMHKQWQNLTEIEKSIFLLCYWSLKICFEEHWEPVNPPNVFWSKEDTNQHIFTLTIQPGCIILCLIFFKCLVETRYAWTRKRTEVGTIIFYKTKGTYEYIKNPYWLQKTNRKLKCRPYQYLRLVRWY